MMQPFVRNGAAGDLPAAFFVWENPFLFRTGCPRSGPERFPRPAFGASGFAVAEDFAFGRGYPVSSRSCAGREVRPSATDTTIR